MAVALKRNPVRSGALEKVSGRPSSRAKLTPQNEIYQRLLASRNGRIKCIWDGRPGVAVLIRRQGLFNVAFYPAGNRPRGKAKIK